MTEHLKNGAMKDHMRNIHKNILTRIEMFKTVSCIKNFIKLITLDYDSSKIDKFNNHSNTAQYFGINTPFVY